MTEQEFRDLKIGDRIWEHLGEVLYYYEISEILSDSYGDLYYLTKSGNYIFLEDIKEYFINENVEEFIWHQEKSKN